MWKKAAKALKEIIKRPEQYFVGFPGKWYEISDYEYETLSCVSGASITIIVTDRFCDETQTSEIVSFAFLSAKKERYVKLNLEYELYQTLFYIANRNEEAIFNLIGKLSDTLPEDED